LYFFNTINNEGILPAIFRNDGDRHPDDTKYFDPVLRIPIENLEKFSQHPGRWYSFNDYKNGKLKSGVDIYA